MDGVFEWAGLEVRFTAMEDVVGVGECIDASVGDDAVVDDWVEVGGEFAVDEIRHEVADHRGGGIIGEMEMCEEIHDGNGRSRGAECKQKRVG